VRAGESSRGVEVVSRTMASSPSALASPDLRTGGPSDLASLQRALEEERFVLHYQPIVSLRDGVVTHHEALVRLQGADGALLAPAAFLPAAERYEIIPEIDRAVLDKALAALSDLSERPPRARVRTRTRADGGAIAVNLSALSLTDAGMLGFLEERLAHHAVGAEALVLELTETASISDMDAAQEFCAGAAALGCEIALDDFGAGFGTFHYLRHLHFDYLKIDGAFIRDLASSPRDRRVVSSLVALARAMGARTIAEYVQDARTLRLLRELGVDHAQGFAVGRPRARTQVMLENRC
jgi:EAL domain-containing protein (putative c-di-GMP-specific phosphodiesterase class I)